MEKNQAAELIKKTFTRGFDEAQFTYFIRNLLNHLDESRPFAYHGQFIPDAYKNHIRQYKRIGKYIDPDENSLDVLIVNLKRETALDRARTMQRNFIAWYLNGGRGKRRDAALVAYHTDGSQDWRFSFVRMDYRTEQDDRGIARLKAELTPARRYSFLVGQNEPNHTAQQQLIPIVQDDGNNPTLDDIEKAFTIESVTREFFEQYKNLFLMLKEELDALVTGNLRVSAEFTAKEISTADFAKKLLGQIVFLYFLQKKGWLGVEKDGAGDFKGWGTGPKDFMRRLYAGNIAPYDNFFNDLLEPLFYEALAIERANDYFSRFDCKIPFLNGGLFEPICGYNWQEVDIHIPDRVFGAIFDTFDLYNFTVREDEPLEKEVAVDPEMLGKVFENLLEVKDRKSKGAYYTPREIVHYMCQESLISYLQTVLDTSIGYESFRSPQSALFGAAEITHPGAQVELMTKVGQSPVPHSDIELYIRLGAFGVQNDQTVEAKGKETSTYSYTLPDSIRANAHRIDQALDDIEICDPAIGSGAFPVGMLHEIVRARETLTPHLTNKSARTAYYFKRHAIQQSIYGVDIDNSAVDIAKLRLWLSLVVDEDDFKTIKPLPNLDYKVVCGDTLHGFPFQSAGLQEIEDLKDRFFDETSPSKKLDLRNLIKQKLQDRFDASEKSVGFRISFDARLLFSEVFRKKGGFDVVIANPPYVRHEAIKEIKPTLKKQFGDFYCGTADLYTYFYKRGLEILKPSGHLCFIAPNKFMRAGYGKNTRRLLAGEATPKVVIDFGDLPIFDATTYPSILLVEKKQPTSADRTLAATFTDAAQLGKLEETLGRIGFDMPVTALRPDGWNLEQPDVLALMEKLRKVGTPLGEYVEGKLYYGIKTGLNEAFVIDGDIRQRLIAEDPKSEELIRPWLRGKDIRKWKAEWAGLYIIAIASSANREWLWSGAKKEKDARKIFAEAYPAVFAHLATHEKKLRVRDDQGQFWWELRSCAYYHEFEKPKIMWRHFTTVPEFIYDEGQHYSNDKSYILPTADLSLLGLLNAKVTNLFLRQLSPPVRGGFLEMRIIYMEQLPVPAMSEPQKSVITKRVQTILADPVAFGVSALEKEIDELVYQLYGLTPEEIALVEGKK